MLWFLRWLDLQRSSSSTICQMERQAREGKELAQGHQHVSRTLKAASVLPRPSFVISLAHCPSLLPGLLQFLTSSPRPASSSAWACLQPHLSPHLLSHCCLCFLLPAPGARGGSPPVSGQCFLYWSLPACLGAPPGPGCPFPSAVFLPRGSEMKGRD